MLSHLNFGRRVGNGDREGFTTFTALRRQYDDHSTAAVATRRTGGETSPPIGIVSIQTMTMVMY